MSSAKKSLCGLRATHVVAGSVSRRRFLFRLSLVCTTVVVVHLQRDIFPSFHNTRERSRRDLQSLGDCYCQSNNTVLVSDFKMSTDAANAENGGLNGNTATPPPLEASSPPPAQPFSGPPLHADSAISVVCGNTRCHWAIHDSFAKDFYPLLFWK